MSSLRVAIGSGLLVVALGAGTWGAANAFPLYAEQVAQAQAPPRDPEAPPRGHVTPSTPRRAPISVRFDDADVSTVVMVISREAKLNVLLDPSLTGRITFEATNIPWDDALRQVLQPLGLTFRISENALIVTQPPPPPPPPPPAPAQTSSTPQFPATATATPTGAHRLFSPGRIHAGVVRSGGCREQPVPNRRGDQVRR